MHGQDPIAADAGGSLGAQPRQRFLALDSLRGLCAVFVALFHFQTIGLICTSLFVRHAYLFVEFFFVLSGFVIAASYGDRLASGFSIPKFMGLRLGRVYPLHLFMLILFLLAELGGVIFARGAFSRTPFSDLNTVPQLIYGLGFVQIFFGTDETGWNAPSWSVSAEVWAYLIFAWLFRIGGRRMGAAALGAVAISFVLYWSMLRAGLNSHHWAALPRCLYGFGVGVVGYRCLPAFRRSVAPIVRRGSRATLVEIGTIVAVVALVIWNASLLAPLLFCGVVLLFALEAGGVSRLLVTRPMLYLGTISYSIYMVHAFVEFRFMNALTAIGHRLGKELVLPGHIVGVSPGFADAVTLAMLPFVIGAASLTYRFIERPGQRWSRRLILTPRERPRAIPAEQEAPTF